MHADDDLPGFAPFAARMEAAGSPALAIQAFRAHYAALCAGDTGELPEAAIAAVEQLPTLEGLPEGLAKLGENNMHRVVFVKLNGGLGTSMGLEQAKSLLPVKGGLRFLDLIAAQARAAGCPLLLMNSFATEADTRAALAAMPPLPQAGLPLDFRQHQVPKVDAQSLAPAGEAADPQAWCPPGHGDLFHALATGGLLDALLAAGRDLLFVSNSDNLGATLDPRILGWMVQERLPFVMEVSRRTPADRKGGHLCQQGGRLCLREVAQCPPADLSAFQDIDKHAFFNTNNLWVDLRAVAARLAAGPLVLPLIRNPKPIDPRDPGSTPVFQLESAMGAAISAFPGAQALVVPRGRMVPVKTTGDLLRVRSDATTLEPGGRVVPAVDPPPRVELDPVHHRLVDQLDAAFPAGPPSLRACTALRLRGPLRFGAGVRCRGAVELEGAGEVPAGSELREGRYQLVDGRLQLDGGPT